MANKILFIAAIIIIIITALILLTSKPLIAPSGNSINEIQNKK